MTRYRPGQSGNPKGRPKGSRNELAQNFLRDAVAAWKEHGVEALKVMATTEQAKFCVMVAGLMPKEVHVGASAVEHMSDDELETALDDVRRFLARNDDADSETQH